MNEPLSRCLRFRTDRFDYSSDLPSDYNAGNRFYGRDVAEFLSEGLVMLGIGADYLDEDWGWLILSTDATAPPFEVAIYNLSEHSEGGRPGANEWGLWIRAYETKKILGLIPKKVETEVPQELEAGIRAVLAKEGIDLEPWLDGPDYDA